MDRETPRLHTKKHPRVYARGVFSVNHARFAMHAIRGENG